MRSFHLTWRALAAGLFSSLCLAVAPVQEPAGEKPFPLFLQDEQFFRHAIARQRAQPFTQRITGITVPHHLLAVDLIAEAFARASAGKYERIVVLSPDHFSRGGTPASTTRRAFETALGEVPVDQAAVTALLADARISISQLFSHEHGVQALLPFIAHHFPGVPIVPLALRIDAHAPELDGIAERLRPLLGERTLVVQSTDFSHFLSPAEATRRDQETLRALASGDPAHLLKLVQPAHLDSLASQYLQMRLQKEVYAAGPTVLQNCNSQRYFEDPVSSTTSYIVQIYSPELLPVLSGQRTYFGGDTFFGRHVPELLDSPTAAASLRTKVLGWTGGAPLIVNLEGVILPKAPARPIGPLELWMSPERTLSWLAALQISAVGLANNHRRDFAPLGSRETRQVLEKAHVTCLGPGQHKDMGEFRLVALSDVDNADPRRRGLLQRSDISQLKALTNARPTMVLLHWGREYTNRSDERDEQVRGWLESAGVDLVIGCHTHRASAGLECRGRTLTVFSLGNFLFDQTDPRCSGALLEIRWFAQGTWFPRVIPIGNLYRQLLELPRE